MPWRLGMPVSPIESLAWLSAPGRAKRIDSVRARTGAPPPIQTEPTPATAAISGSSPAPSDIGPPKKAQRRQTAAHAAVCHDAGNSAVIWVFVGGVG